MARCTVLPLSSLTIASRDGIRPFSTALTFDDGNSSDYTIAFPELARQSMSATFFITPTLVGTRGYVTWAEVKEMARGGMWIGAHGLEHKPLSLLGDDQLYEELREARRWIDSETGGKTTALALPGGYGDARVVRAAAATGYSVICGSVPGRLRKFESGKAIPRFAVRCRDSMWNFEALLRRHPAALAGHVLRHWCLRWLQRGVGQGGYQQIRRAWGRRRRPAG